MFQDESEVVTINGYSNIPKNNEESMLKALAHQPISVAISASGRDFQLYSGVSLLRSDTYGSIYAYSTYIIYL